MEGVQLRGTNAAAQNGVELTSCAQCCVSHCYIESVALGVGIHADLALSLQVTDNVIGACQTAIMLQGPAGCAVERNQANYWADHGVWIRSLDDALGPRVNRVIGNILHGNGGTAQDVAQARAAIRVSRVGTCMIESNYIERVLDGASAGDGHGIWIDGEELTQGNVISSNYFGPGTTGHAVRITGLSSHTRVSGNAMPAAYTILDDGLYTQYLMQQLSSPDQITGTSVTRRGWVSLAGGPVQLHQ